MGRGSVKGAPALDHDLAQARELRGAVYSARWRSVGLCALLEGGTRRTA